MHPLCVSLLTILAIGLPRAAATPPGAAPRAAPAIAARPLVAAADANPEADAIRALQRAIGRRSAETRTDDVAAALDALKPHDSAPVAEALIDAFLAIEAELAPLEASRADFLGRMANDEKQELRTDLIPLHTLQDDLDAALHRPRTGDARAAMLRRALAEAEVPLSFRRWLAGRGGALAAGGLAADDARGLVGRALVHRREELRIAGLDAVLALGAEARPLGARVLALLEDDEPALRARAADALAVLCLPESIDPLLARLAAEEGRSGERVAAALEVLTRQRLGTSLEAWRRWREREGDAFVRGEVKLGGGTPSDPAAAAAQYHGLPLEGRNILFVIDRSLSMRQEMASKSRAKSPEESRMHRAKEELKRALGLLTKEHRFNILSFAMTRRTFADGLVRPDRKTMKAALTFLDDMEMEFGTQIYDALQHAFQIAGRGAEDAFYDCEVDTIYLLTDGRPYVGNKSDSTRRIRNAARRWNALGRVRIHVIGLGTDIPAKFLQGLADDSGGRFVHETKAPEGKK